MQPTTERQLEQIFQSQRTAFFDNPMPDRNHRDQKLLGLKNALLQHQDRICEAVSGDFGHRSRMDTLLSDILPTVVAIKHARRNLKAWMRPQKRSTGLFLMPASLQVTFQPKGVVGIVVPWNFPIMLSLGPLIGAIAAGNRAMIKMSEKTPATNEAVQKMLVGVFDEREVAVILGEIDIAKSFTALPFDHLLFTGSTAVGRQVMQAAAGNLTPVTLELGGKSPLIVGPDVDADIAAGRAMFGKCVNAAQICVAPDYVLIPQEKVEGFVTAGSKLFNEFYPAGIHSEDYTSIVDSDQYQRLIGMLDDAKAKGAKIVPACEDCRDDSRRRMAIHFVLNTSPDMDIMKNEIFGPLLPVIPYDNIDKAIHFVRQRPRPLAMYLISFDRSLQKKVIGHSHAGGMSINDTLLHVAADDAPFGGIGESGMGRYHGREGFQTFSNTKTVYRRGRINFSRAFQPPYGGWLQRMLLRIFLR